MNTVQQMTLFGSSVVRTAFAETEVKNRDGALVGYAYRPRPFKEVAAELGLSLSKENRPKVQEAILSAGDAALKQVVAELTKLGPDWTLDRLATRINAKDEKTITLKVREASRMTTIGDDKIAIALGWFDEDGSPDVGRVGKARESQQRQLAGQTLDVESETETAQ